MANNRKKGSPAGVIFALLMLVVIVVALVIVLRSCSMDTGDGGTTPPAATENTAVTEPPQTAAPATESPAAQTVPPTQTPAPTPSPTPSPTPAPESSGSFRSDTGTSLNITVNWSISGSGSQRTLLATVYAESWGLQSVSAWHGGWLTIGGQTYYFDTEEINYDGSNGLGSSLLGTVSADISSLSLPATAELTWAFRGSYSGVDLDTITATGSVG